MTPSNLSTRLLTVAAFTLASSVGTAQSTWFVDVAAAGPGDGTSADPFPTIQQAIDDVDTVDGDTVSVAPGTYAEWVRYGNKRITIQSQGGPLVTTIVPPASTGEFVVRMSTASGLVGAVLEGFTVSGLPGVDSSGVWGAGGRVVRCILRDHRSAAPGVSYGAFSNFDLFLEECTIVGNEGGVHPGIFFLLMYATNTAIHGNDTDIGPDGDPTNLLISYSSWGQDNGFPYGPTNLVGQDPGFWKEDGEDLHLSPGSPLIDAGNPAAPLDADGSTIDIGALTYDPAYAPAPRVYCTSKLSSDSCLPTIGATGTAGFNAPGPFTITADNVSESKTGLFFFGLGESTFPFQGGWFCVTPPTARTGVQFSGSQGAPCTGAFAVDFNAFLQANPLPFLAPGDLIYGQYWMRDPGDPFGSVRSDAIEFGLAE